MWMETELPVEMELALESESDQFPLWKEEGIAK